jgi:hypothetical protein
MSAKSQSSAETRCPAQVRFPLITSEIADITIGRRRANRVTSHCGKQRAFLPADYREVGHRPADCEVRYRPHFRGVLSFSEVPVRDSSGKF